jgi:hypothetical protein
MAPNATINLKYVIFNVFDKNSDETHPSNIIKLNVSTNKQSPMRLENTVNSPEFSLVVLLKYTTSKKEVIPNPSHPSITVNQDLENTRKNIDVTNKANIVKNFLLFKFCFSVISSI